LIQVPVINSTGYLSGSAILNLLIVFSAPSFSIFKLTSNRLTFRIYSLMETLIRTIDTAIAQSDYATLSAVFAAAPTPTLSWHSIGPGEQRSLAAHLLQAAVASPTFFPQALASEEVQQVLLMALGHLPATVEHAADSRVRQMLFESKIHASSSSSDIDYAGAARILGGMRMEDDPHNVYYVPPAERMDIYVKIAECFLAEDLIAEADAAVTKAGALMDGSNSSSSAFSKKEDHLALLLRYKSTYARVLDANRKFLTAAQRYYELSQSASDIVDHDDLLTLLGMAVTCAILAPHSSGGGSSGGAGATASISAGGGGNATNSQRQRVLSQIVADDRLSQLDQMPQFASHTRLLRKMHRLEIIHKTELISFEQTLADHQKAIRGDGLSILERIVIEHNMMAVSRLYQSIYFADLQEILGVPTAHHAEQLAAQMILEGSLPSGTSIYQVEGLLEFPDNDNEDASHASVTLDEAILQFCTEINRVAEAIQQTTAATLVASHDP
jgi:COP9 signalosome complex subunit 4